MRKVQKFLLMSLFSFIISSTTFARSGDISFDKSNSIVLSDGPMPKVSIPLPKDWKNVLDNPELSDFYEFERKKIPNEDIVSLYYSDLNEDRIEYVKISVIKKFRSVAIKHREYIEMQDYLIKSGLLNESNRKKFLIQ